MARREPSERKYICTKKVLLDLSEIDVAGARELRQEPGVPVLGRDVDRRVARLVLVRRRGPGLQQDLQHVPDERDKSLGGTNNFIYFL